MPHFFLQVLGKNEENEWSLVRETPSSQKFKVTLTDGNELSVDVHYTMPKILNVTIAGPGQDLSRHVLGTVMNELAQIALKTGIDYAVIDYTLITGDSMTEGNYTIDQRARVTLRL